MKKVFILSIVLSVASLRCADEGPPLTEVSLDPKTSTIDELIQDVMDEIPSPAEIAMIVKNSGVNFSKDILHDPDEADEYTTVTKKSLNLGIYFADLACVYIYGKTGISIEYVSAIRELADELKVEQFFNYKTLQRLSESDKNVDSMLHTTTRNFESMCNYMKTRGRGLQSLLIIVGGWVESLHLALNLTASADINDFISNYPQLVERIGEQKNIVDRIVLVISLYDKEPGFSDFLWELKQVQSEYESVKINYKYQDPELKEINGDLVVDDKSISDVQMKPKDIEDISKAIKKLRDKIINTKRWSKYSTGY